MSSWKHGDDTGTERDRVFAAASGYGRTSTSPPPSPVRQRCDFILNDVFWERASVDGTVVGCKEVACYRVLPSYREQTLSGNAGPLYEASA